MASRGSTGLKRRLLANVAASVRRRACLEGKAGQRFGQRRCILHVDQFGQAAQEFVIILAFVGQPLNGINQWGDNFLPLIV
jgi:hypothetical protein